MRGREGEEILICVGGRGRRELSVRRGEGEKRVICEGGGRGRR